METFSLLKYWRGGGGAAGAAFSSSVDNVPPTTTSTNAAVAAAAAAATVATSVLSPSASSSISDEDDTSFFDLEFSIAGDEDLAAGEEKELHIAGDGELEIQSEPVSPSDDLFFRGNSIVISASDSDTRSPQFPVSFLKSATKIRVFLLGLRKPRPASPEPNATSAAAAPSAIVSPKPRFLIVSLFARDTGSKLPKPPPPAATAAASVGKEDASVTAEERKFAKEVVLKYLNKIKPLYVRVSKRYGEKLRFSASEGEETDAETEAEVAVVTQPPPTAESTAAAAAAPVVVACGVRAPRASVPAGLKEVCKRLGKSRSASSAAVAAVSTPAAAPPPPPQRRDDSLLQQQDGIQSAIAHCKRSFNSSKGSESPLLRSMSDPGEGRVEKECV